MLKKIVISSIVIFIAVAVLDILIHGVILESAYIETAQLWRSMDEMESYMPWMYCVTLVYAILFSIIYALYVAPKSLATGIKFGLLLGLASGVSMGIGSYLVMPITPVIALVWFLGTTIEITVAGLIAAAVIKAG
jgi:hypothetical protein